MRTIEQRELLRGRRRCESRHPNWGGVRCERGDAEHYFHHADGYTFEWVHVLAVRTGFEYRDDKA